MNSIISRVSYLNGLIQGLGITNETKEGKAITEIADILKDMAIEIEDLQYSRIKIENYIDEINDDLREVEDQIFENEDKDEAEDEYYDDCFHVKCPHCNETVFLDKDIINEKEETLCPNCHESLELNSVDL